ncbi:MAG: restriction endonuclease [Granulosicoccus sp.]
MSRTDDHAIASLPWWILLFIGVIGYGALRFVLPALSFDHVLFQGLATATPALALPFFLLFLFLAVASAIKRYVKRKHRIRLLDRQQGVASIRALSWQAFEQLVGEAYRRQGFTVLENARAGADDGVDLELSRDGETTLVQCKRWRSNRIGVSIIREHLGVMVSRGISRGIVVCSGRFTKPAIVFARANHIELTVRR